MIKHDKVTIILDYVAGLKEKHTVTVEELPARSELNPTPLDVTKILIIPALIDNMLTLSLAQSIGGSGSNMRNQELGWHSLIVG